MTFAKMKNEKNFDSPPTQIHTKKKSNFKHAATAKKIQMNKK